MLVGATPRPPLPGMMHLSAACQLFSVRMHHYRIPMHAPDDPHRFTLLLYVPAPSEPTALLAIDRLPYQGAGAQAESELRGTTGRPGE